MVRPLLLPAAGLAAAGLLLAACGDGDDQADPRAADMSAPEEPEGYDLEEQPEAAAATFITPTDGDTVDSPVTVEMRAEAVTIVAAGEPVAGEGHFHLIVDVGCVDHGEVVPGPSDEATAEGYIHLGDGSDRTELELEPGTYDLCVQLADGIHQAFGQPDTITITVE